MSMTYKQFQQFVNADALINRIPLNSTFSLTPRCNLHCKMCLICNPTEVVGDEMSGDWWLDLARQARDEGMAFCMITGGEPILHRDFWQIYEGVRKLGVHMILNSNGTTITPEVADRLAKMRPMLMQISVYGSSPEAYKRVTGSAAGFEKTIRGIELLRERGIDVMFRSMLMRETADDMENIAKLILSYGVKFKYGNYIMMPMWENCNDVRSMRLSGKEIAEYTIKIENTIKEYHDTHEKPNADDISDEMREEYEERSKKPVDPAHVELRRRVREIKSKSAFKCSAGTSYFSVRHDGFIRLCEVAGDPDMLFDLKQISFKDGLERLWTAAASVPTCAECEGCPDLKKCSPCPPRHFAESGSYLRKADYVCEYVRADVKLIE